MIGAASVSRWNAAGVAGLAAVAALAAAACSADPSGSTAETTTTTAMVDGLAITLSADRASVPPGGRLEILATVVNAGPTPVQWRAGGCLLRSSISVTRQLPDAEAAPVDAFAGLHELELALLDAVGVDLDMPAAVHSLASSAEPGTDGCQIDRGFSELAPGARLTERATWSPFTAGAAPAGAGAYVATSLFPRLRPGVAVVPADYQAVRDLAPVTTDLAFEVLAGADPVISARSALGHLLRDTALGDLVQTGRVRPGDVSIQFREGSWSALVRFGSDVLIGHVAGDGHGLATLVRGGG